MILGLASLPLVFLCLGIITGILAIVFGFIGLSAVSKGQGRIKGKGMAWTGITSAILAFVIYGFFVAKVAKENANMPEGERNARAALSNAQTKVLTDNQGKAHGNNAEAKLLAEEFSSTMKTMHSAFFEREGDAPKVSISGGEFVTFCQLSDEGCAFIVHVPEYRRHTDEAKESLAELAWIVAGSVAESHPEALPSQSTVAVGLRGAILYGAILIGEAGGETPASSSTDDAKLLPFFEPEEEAGLIEAESSEGS